MKTKIIKSLVLALALSLASTSAYAVWPFSKKKPQTQNQVNTEGGEVVTVVLTGKEYVELEKVKAAEKSNEKFFDAQKKKYSQVDSEDMALVLAIEGLAGQKNPTNFNDSEVAKYQASAEKHKYWSGALVGTAKVVTGGVVNVTAVDKIAGAFTATASNAGGNTTTTNNSTTTNSADNGSTVGDTTSVDNGSTNQSAQGESYVSTDSSTDTQTDSSTETVFQPEDEDDEVEVEELDSEG